MFANLSSTSGLVGQSPAIRRAIEQIGRVGISSIWVHGEVGTNKLAVARAVHERGPRRNEPLQVVDCGVVPPRLTASVLFGHESGAFLGATSRHRGALERANRGVLFLRAIERLAPVEQARLVRVLDTGMMRPVGSGVSRPVDVQIVAASHLRLDSVAHHGTFRRDLVERLSTTAIGLPPLRQRREDIPLLVWHIVRFYAERFGKRLDIVPDDIMDTLVAYDWPGNQWELEQIVGRGVFVAERGRLSIDPAWMSSSLGDPRPLPASERLSDVERAHIEGVLDRCDGRVKGEDGAAARLGLHPSTLYSRMHKLGISVARAKAKTVR